MHWPSVNINIWLMCILLSAVYVLYQVFHFAMWGFITPLAAQNHSTSRWPYKCKIYKCLLMWYKDLLVKWPLKDKNPTFHKIHNNTIIMVLLTYHLGERVFVIPKCPLNMEECHYGGLHNLHNDVTIQIMEIGKITICITWLL